MPRVGVVPIGDVARPAAEMLGLGCRGILDIRLCQSSMEESGRGSIMEVLLSPESAAYLGRLNPIGTRDLVLSVVQ